MTSTTRHTAPGRPVSSLPTALSVASGTRTPSACARQTWPGMVFESSATMHAVTGLGLQPSAGALSTGIAGRRPARPHRCAQPRARVCVRHVDGRQYRADAGAGSSRACHPARSASAIAVRSRHRCGTRQALPTRVHVPLARRIRDPSSRQHAVARRRTACDRGAAQRSAAAGHRARNPRFGITLVTAGGHVTDFWPFGTFSSR